MFRNLDEKEKNFFAVFSIITLFVLLVSVSGVKADFTFPDSYVDVETVNWSSDQSGINSYCNQVFYHNASDRWYIIYAYDASSHDYNLRYSYSDSGDLSSWNNGGTIAGSSYLRTVQRSLQMVSAQYAWVYDNENEIGHLVKAEDDSSGGTYGLHYQNFTINNSTGVITFGSIRGLYTQTSGSCYPACDIALSQSNRPIISYTGIIDIGSGEAVVYLCDSINGYSDNWNAVQYTSGLGGGASITQIPTGNTSCLSITLDVDAVSPANYLYIDFGVTSNGSSPSQLTDNSLNRHGYLNGVDDIYGFGSSWNTTHGFIAYCDSSNDAYAFYFDFETLTFSDEVMYFESTGGQIGGHNSIVVNNNEAFLINKIWTTSNTNQDLEGTEMYNATYEGYFNSSTTQTVLDDYFNIYYDYCPLGVNMGKFTDNDDNTVIMIARGNEVSVTYWNVEGEFTTPSETETEETEIEVSTIFIFLAVISFCVIMYLIINAKKELG